MLDKTLVFSTEVALPCCAIVKERAS